MDIRSEHLFETYSAHQLKDLFLSLNSGEHIEIRMVNYEPVERADYFHGRVIFETEVAFHQQERKTLQNFASTGLWKAAGFYQGDDFRRFVNGPQSVFYCIGRADYRTPFGARPIAVAIIAGFVTILPLPQLT